jgi:hypothetical protein
MDRRSDGQEDRSGNDHFHHWVPIQDWLCSEQTPNAFRRRRLALEPLFRDAAALKEGDDLATCVWRERREMMALATGSA